jgi:hypothetical protein
LNPWVKKSINIALSDGYLDSLLKIYDVSTVIPREIPVEIEKEIRSFHAKKKPLQAC